jgi:CheY-like chemotaxis protein
MKGDRERCLEAGMDGYLSKPIHPSELFKVITEITPATNGEGAYPSIGQRQVEMRSGQ